MKNNFIVCLMGPTACGKTALGIELAKQIQAEIISVDSALIYRGMNIGTAKPSVEEMDGVVHHLIDIIDPGETYSAADFKNDAMKLIEQIQGRGHVPLLVGGTMLYFKALLGGISDLPASDPKIRQMLQQRIRQEGLESLHTWLCQLDPVAGERINVNDEQRLLRALEVKLISGKTITELTAQSREKPFEQPAVQFALIPPDREKLREKIGLRFDQMIENGLIDEVRHLKDRGDLHPDMPSIRAVGYRQCWTYLEGGYDLKEMIFRGKVATCQLAKRQLTWLRGWRFPLTVLDPGAEDNLAVMLKQIKQLQFSDEQNIFP